MYKPTEHPRNEISWEDRPAKLLKIKVGDRVWIGEGAYPCSKGIKEVTRLTDTLIIVGKGTERWERFRKENGYQVGKMMFADFISGIATEAEVKAYDAEQKRKKDDAERRQNAEKARAALLEELNSLFPEDSIYVRTANYDDSDDSLTRFAVTISELTADEVRKIAPKLKQIKGL